MYTKMNIKINEIVLIRIWEAGPKILPLVMDGRNSSALVIGVPEPGKFKGARIVYPEETYEVDENCVFFHRANDVYTTYIDNFYTRCLVINFNGENLPAHFCVPNCADLRSKFEAIYSIWLNRRYDDFYELDCIGLTMQLMAEVLRRKYSSDNSASAKQRVRSAIEYIHNNFTSSELKISDIAAHCGISERYLCKLFDSAVGLSPKEYIIKLRIDYAKKLLSGTSAGEGFENTVENITTLVGFNDSNHFSTLFRKKTGLSPSRYRKNTNQT